MRKTGPSLRISQSDPQSPQGPHQLAIVATGGGLHACTPRVNLGTVFRAGGEGPRSLTDAAERSYSAWAALCFSVGAAGRQQVNTLCFEHVTFIKLHLRVCNRTDA
jgi:hypothetical protein